MTSTTTPLSRWLSQLVVDGESHDIAAVRQVLLAAAERVCTRKQLAVVTQFIKGASIVELAARMGVAHTTVHKHLNGWPATDGGRWGGALSKMRAALVEDQEFITEVTRMAKTELAKAPALPVGTEAVTGWFSQLAPSRETLFGPLAVLLVAYHVCDARRSISVADLCLYVPRKFVAAALGPLRAAGYVATDGVTLTLRRTPLDDMRDT